jgi:hypothetical protein
MYFVIGDPELQEYKGKCYNGFCDMNSPPDLIDTGCTMDDQCYERYHWGSCSWVDVGVELSADEPAYWAASSGLPGPNGGVSPFTILDPGPPPGRPDGTGDRVLRGYILAWAVDNEGNPIRWNHLKGDALLVNYRNMSAWEYNAYAFQVHSVLHEQLVPMPVPLPDETPWAELKLDGTDYDACFDELLLDFYSPYSYALTSADCDGKPMDQCDHKVQVFTDLTLMPALIDLRQDGDGPVTTKAKFVICDENETCLSNTTRCITCWDQEWLRKYDPPNHFVNMQTDKGKARIDGVASGWCDDGVVSEDAPLLGVAMKMLVFTDRYDSKRGMAQAGMNLVGMGTEDGVIKADLEHKPPDEKPGADDTIRIDKAVRDLR